MARRYLYIAFLFLMGLSSIAMANSYAPENYMWLTVGDLTKEKDGTISRYFTVHTASLDGLQPAEIKGLAVFYRIYTTSRYSGPTKNTEWRACTLQERHGKLSIRAHSGQYGMAQVFITGMVGGKCCFAQADVFMFPVRNRFAKVFPSASETAPAWPDTYPVAMVETPNYWPQTGREITFRWMYLDTDISSVRVMDGGRFITTFPVSDVYAYTPSDNPQLNHLGTRAWKNIVFLAASDKASYAFTTVVHRSRTEHMKLWPGLGVTVSAAFLTLLGIILIRKKRGRRV